MHEFTIKPLLTKVLPLEEGRYIATTTGIRTVDAAFHVETFEGASFTAKAIAFGKRFISSEYYPVNHLANFLRECDGLILDLGSGSRCISPRAINVDLFPFPNVHIVADIDNVPLIDGCADAIVLDSVIEHLATPQSVIDEAWRLLRPGGRIFIQVPMVFPYHGYPAHFQNFTADGLDLLLSRFEGVRVRSATGPFSMLVNAVSEVLAVLVSGGRGSLYAPAKALALLPIFWIKWLDYFVPDERAKRISGLLCAVGTKA